MPLGPNDNRETKELENELVDSLCEKIDAFIALEIIDGKTHIICGFVHKGSLPKKIMNTIEQRYKDAGWGYVSFSDGCSYSFGYMSSTTSKQFYITLDTDKDYGKPLTEDEIKKVKNPEFEEYDKKKGFFEKLFGK